MGTFAWPFGATPDAYKEDGGYSSSPHMDSLNPRMVAMIVLLQLPIHFLRDCIKMGVYRYFQNKDQAEVDEQVEEKKRIDRDVESIMQELGYSRKTKAEMASSVTLQAIVRERSQKFSGMRPAEREEVAMVISRQESTKQTPRHLERKSQQGTEE